MPRNLLFCQLTLTPKIEWKWLTAKIDNVSHETFWEQITQVKNKGLFVTQRLIDWLSQKYF